LADDDSNVELGATSLGIEGKITLLEGIAKSLVEEVAASLAVEEDTSLELEDMALA
jgi:hypothetical protein